MNPTPNPDLNPTWTRSVSGECEYEYNVSLMNRRRFITTVTTAGTALTIAGCVEAGRKGNGGATEEQTNSNNTTGGNQSSL